MAEVSWSQCAQPLIRPVMLVVPIAGIRTPALVLPSLPREQHTAGIR